MLIVLAATLPALGLSLYTGLEHRTQAAINVKDEALRLVRLTSAQERLLIDGSRQLLSGLAQLRQIKNREPVECSRLLEGMLQQHPQYLNLGVADARGNITCSALTPSPEDGTVNISDRPYFREAMETGEFTISTFQVDRIAHKSAVCLCRPLLVENGKPDGVIFASLDLSWFYKIASSTGLPDGAAVTIRDANGTILVRYPSPDTWVSKSIPEAPILKAILEKQGEGVAEAEGVDDIPRMYAFKPISYGTGATVYLSIGIPSNIAFAESRRELIRNMFGVGGASFLSILAAWFFGRLFFLRKIDILEETTGRLTAGELTVRIPIKDTEADHNELDRLANSFNVMAASLENQSKRLHEAETRYRMLVERIPAVTYMAAPDETRSLLYISPQSAVLLGYAPDEFLRDSNLWASRLHADDAERVLSIFRATAAGSAGTAVSCEYRIWDRSGKELWIRDEASLVGGDEANPHVLHGIMRDITERKIAEEAVRRSEARYRTIFETTGTATIIISDDMRIELANAEFVQLSGYNRLILESEKKWSDFFTREDASRMEEYHRMRRIEPQSAPRSYETRFRGKDGVIRHMLATVAMIPGTSNSVASFLDVSERKMADEALKQSEERYRQFFEEDLTGDFIVRPNGEPVACNPAYAAMFGFQNVEEAMSVPMSRLCIDAGQWDNLIRLVRENRKLEYYEAELRRCDGKPVFVIANILGLLSNDGTFFGIRGYFFDNTDRKKLEEQLLQSQKMDAIGKLAGGVAHDFNNVLTIITGYSEIVLDSINPEDPLRKYVDEIRKAGERAAALTRQLLAFSRKQVMQPKIMNLNHTVRDIEKMLHRLIGEDIHLFTALDPDLGAVKADPGQIEQVIMNLAVNARDAMPTGGKIMIETSNATIDTDYASRHLDIKAGDYIMLAVSDTGTGMDEETRLHIFEPFFTTKATGKGTGLGLSTVYGIVKQSNGHIWVYSEPNIGTTFKLYLPAMGKDRHVPPQPSESRKFTPSGSETVLVVEDDEMVRETVFKILQRGGYHVLQSSRVTDAFLTAERYEGPIHLLVSDIVMPVMNGRELAQRLKTFRPEMKILFISGYTQNTMADQGVIDAGAAFLQKPFTPEHLARKVREVLDTPMETVNTD